MKIKEKLYQYCLNDVNRRLTQIKDEMSQTQAAANEETKSSAGDKYETGRAMAQLEVDRYKNQQIETEKLLKTLQAISQRSESNIAIPGSLIRTHTDCFYIAISLGAVIVDDGTYFVISSASPIGRILLGKKKGDTFSWNEKVYVIHSIE
jgi:hypothetical protein